MLTRILLYLIIFFVLMHGYVKLIETKTVFFPTKNIIVTPQFIDLAYKNIYLTTKDGLKINGWFLPDNQARYTLLFLHGNAGNIGDRLDKLEILKKAKLNILIIDYRGYGNSQGSPSEQAVYIDAQAAYDYLIKEEKIDPQEIILYGESLGCAVAIDLASKVKAKALVVEGGFSSGKDMAKIMYPLLPGFFFRHKLDSLAKIKEVKVAKLFMHSKNDEVVPLKLAKKLFDYAPEPKEFIELIGGHNDAFLDSREQYISSIISFIERL
jgi:fermentation-respiration switch protein FrsA (DUF1100 family)